MHEGGFFTPPEPNKHWQRLWRGFKAVLIAFFCLIAMLAIGTAVFCIGIWMGTNIPLTFGILVILLVCYLIGMFMEWLGTTY